MEAFPPFAHGKQTAFPPEIENLRDKTRNKL